MSPESSHQPEHPTENQSTSKPSPGQTSKGVRKTVWFTALIATGMLGFGFAIVPLYDLICEVTGIGGRVVSAADESEVAEASVYPSRSLTLRMDATVGSVGKFTFAPPADSMILATGRKTNLSYTVENKTGKTVVGQAIPSIVPAEATRYVKKLECFCFEQQILHPDETVDLPVQIIIDSAVPDEIEEITLSYIYYDASEQNPELLQMDHSRH